MRRWHRLLAAALAGTLLAGCASERPWINQPIQPTSPAPRSLLPGVAEGELAEAAPQHIPSIATILALSGGGARAAAFGLGVLDELKATRFEWEGQPATLLDSVQLISGVSGGSVLAAYYAAYGDKTLSDFEHDFLLADFQGELVGEVFTPGTMHRLTSPWVGRSNVFANQLDEKVFHGLTFGQLRARQAHPQLLVTAMDLTTGAPFEFTPEQFALICSDLDSVPLAFAVAASSAVPVLLSPMTLRNYAGSCPQSDEVAASAESERNAQARMLYASVRSYLDAKARPYLHLVDGGLTDNLGVRGMLDRTIASGSLDASFRGVPPHSLRELVLISVNSERDTAERIDQSDKVPSTSQVLDALVFGAGSRATQETLAVMRDDAKRWAKELATLRGRPGSPFAPDAQLHVISVSLRDLQDPELRQRLLHVPTAFTILPVQVRKLREAGREVLRESKEFQGLRESLGLPGAAQE